MFKRQKIAFFGLFFAFFTLIGGNAQDLRTGNTSSQTVQHCPEPGSENEDGLSLRIIDNSELPIQSEDDLLSYTVSITNNGDHSINLGSTAISIELPQGIQIIRQTQAQSRDNKNLYFNFDEELEAGESKEVNFYAKATDLEETTQCNTEDFGYGYQVKLEYNGNTAYSNFACTPVQFLQAASSISKKAISVNGNTTAPFNALPGDTIRWEVIFTTTKANDTLTDFIPTNFQPELGKNQWASPNFSLVSSNPAGATLTNSTEGLFTINANNVEIGTEYRLEIDTPIRVDALGPFCNAVESESETEGDCVGVPLNIDKYVKAFVNEAGTLETVPNAPQNSSEISGKVSNTGGGALYCIRISNQADGIYQNGYTPLAWQGLSSGTFNFNDELPAGGGIRLATQAEINQAGSFASQLAAQVPAGYTMPSIQNPNATQNSVGFATFGAGLASLNPQNKQIFDGGVCYVALFAETLPPDDNSRFAECNNVPKKNGNTFYNQGRVTFDYEFETELDGASLGSSFGANCAALIIRQQEETELSIEKDIISSDVRPGGSITFNVTIFGENGTIAGPTNGENFVRYEVLDDFFQGLTLVSPNSQENNIGNTQNTIRVRQRTNNTTGLEYLDIDIKIAEDQTVPITQALTFQIPENIDFTNLAVKDLLCNHVSLEDIENTELDSANTCQSPIPELQITKTEPAGGPFFAGDIVNYSVQLENTGTAALNTVTVIDTLQNGQSSTANTFNLAAGATQSLNFSFEVPPNYTGQFCNQTVLVSGTASANGEEFAFSQEFTGVDIRKCTEILPAEPKLTVSKGNPSPSQLTFGQTEAIEYTITVQNAPNVGPATEFTFSEELAGLSNFLTNINVNGCQKNGNSFTCGLTPPLEAGQSRTFSLFASINWESVNPNVFTTGTCKGFENKILFENTLAAAPCVSVQLTPAIEITKRAITPPEGSIIAPNSPITYEITVKNSGQTDLQGVVIEDAFEYTEKPASPWVCQQGTCKYTVGNLAVDEEQRVTIQTLVPELVSIPQNNQICNQAFVNAQVSAQYADNVVQNTIMGQPSNNVCHTYLQPEVSILKLSCLNNNNNGHCLNPAQPFSFRPEESFFYTIFIEELSNVTVENLTITDVLPSELEIVGVIPEGGSINQQNTITWNSIRLNAGEDKPITFEVRLKNPDLEQDCKTFTNTATVSGGGITAANNSATDNNAECIPPKPEVNITKTALPAPNSIENEFPAFQITVENNSEADFKDLIVINDPVSRTAGFNFTRFEESLNGTGGVYPDQGRLILQDGLEQGQSTTFTIYAELNLQEIESNAENCAFTYENRITIPLTEGVSITNDTAIFSITLPSWKCAEPTITITKSGQNVSISEENSVAQQAFAIEIAVDTPAERPIQSINIIDTALLGVTEIYNVNVSENFTGDFETDLDFTNFTLNNVNAGTYTIYLDLETKDLEFDAVTCQLELENTLESANFVVENSAPQAITVSAELATTTITKTGCGSVPTITKTPNNTKVGVNETIIYTITAQNLTPGVEYTITDVIPEGLQAITPETVTFVADSEEYTFEIEVKLAEIPTNIAGCQTFTNTGQISSQNTAEIISFESTPVEFCPPKIDKQYIGTENIQITKDIQIITLEYQIVLENLAVGIYTLEDIPQVILDLPGNVIFENNTSEIIIESFTERLVVPVSVEYNLEGLTFTEVSALCNTEIGINRVNLLFDDQILVSDSFVGEIPVQCQSGELEFSKKAIQNGEEITQIAPNEEFIFVIEVNNENGFEDASFTVDDGNLSQYQTILDFDETLLTQNLTVPAGTTASVEIPVIVLPITSSSDCTDVINTAEITKTDETDVLASPSVSIRIFDEDICTPKPKILVKKTATESQVITESTTIEDIFTITVQNTGEALFEDTLSVRDFLPTVNGITFTTQSPLQTNFGTFEITNLSHEIPNNEVIITFDAEINLAEIEITEEIKENGCVIPLNNQLDGVALQNSEFFQLIEEDLQATYTLQLPDWKCSAEPNIVITKTGGETTLNENDDNFVASFDILVQVDAESSVEMESITIIDNSLQQAGFENIEINAVPAQGVEINTETGEIRIQNPISGQDYNIYVSTSVPAANFDENCQIIIPNSIQEASVLWQGGTFQPDLSNATADFIATKPNCNIILPPDVPQSPSITKEFIGITADGTYKFQIQVENTEYNETYELYEVLTPGISLKFTEITNTETVEINGNGTIFELNEVINENPIQVIFTPEEGASIQTFTVEMFSNDVPPTELTDENGEICLGYENRVVLLLDSGSIRSDSDTCEEPLEFPAPNIKKTSTLQYFEGEVATILPGENDLHILEIKNLQAGVEYQIIDRVYNDWSLNVEGQRPKWEMGDGNITKADLGEPTLEVGGNYTDVIWTFTPKTDIESMSIGLYVMATENPTHQTENGEVCYKNTAVVVLNSEGSGTLTNEVSATSRSSAADDVNVSTICVIKGEEEEETQTGNLKIDKRAEGFSAEDLSLVEKVQIGGTIRYTLQINEMQRGNSYTITDTLPVGLDIEEVNTLAVTPNTWFEAKDPEINEQERTLTWNFTVPENMAQIEINNRDVLIIFEVPVVFTPESTDNTDCGEGSWFKNIARVENTEQMSEWEEAEVCIEVEKSNTTAIARKRLGKIYTKMKANTKEIECLDRGWLGGCKEWIEWQADTIEYDEEGAWQLYLPVHCVRQIFNDSCWPDTTREPRRELIENNDGSKLLLNDDVDYAWATYEYWIEDAQTGEKLEEIPEGMRFALMEYAPSPYFAWDMVFQGNSGSYELGAQISGTKFYKDWNHSGANQGYHVLLLDEGDTNTSGTIVLPLSTGYIYQLMGLTEGGAISMPDILEGIVPCGGLLNQEKVPTGTQVDICNTLMLYEFNKETEELEIASIDNAACFVAECNGECSDPFDGAGIPIIQCAFDILMIAGDIAGNLGASAASGSSQSVNCPTFTKKAVRGIGKYIPSTFFLDKSATKFLEGIMKGGF